MSMVVEEGVGDIFVSVVRGVKNYVLIWPLIYRNKILKAVESGPL